MKAIADQRASLEVRRPTGQAATIPTSASAPKTCAYNQNLDPLNLNLAPLNLNLDPKCGDLDPGSTPALTLLHPSSHNQQVSANQRLNRPDRQTPAETSQGPPMIRHRCRRTALS